MKDENKTKFMMAKDPVHVGTGGYKLGRVDNTIVREPGTKIPKIPGSTLNGAARTYTYYHLKENSDKKPNKACALGKKIEGQEPCGNCPICNNYGFTTESKSKRSQVNFSDARILFFPVHSMVGPVWITCPSILKDVNIKYNNSIDDLENKVITDVTNNKINLGWLYLSVKEEKNPLDDEKISNKIPKKVVDNIVLVSDKVFSQIINSNLEVRTSVSIDPETGAAEDGALFTYEAIPRGTIFWFDIIIQEGNEIPKEIEKGLEKFETLGVGGMTSRGFGRVKIFKSNNFSGGNND